MLIVGAGNMIRECVTMHRGTEHGNMRTVVGSGNLLMANSHVAHDCVIGDNNVFANSAGLAGHVTIFNNVILGGMVGIHQFCRIGSYAFLSAGSMIGHDVPPYCIAQGDRCFLRGLNLIGLQRSGFTAEQISDIKKTYRTLFMRSGHIRNKMPEMPEELASKPHVKAMLDFIAETQRGILSTSRDHQTRDSE
jgi:UDP-N-acetylglucosamine acyltransferase